MKFNLKAIAAAALVAATGSSFAAIDLNNSANPDVFFVAFDFGAGVGFALDTNIDYSTLTTGFNFTYDLDNSAAWTQFRTSSSSNGSSTGIQFGTYSSKTGVGQGFLTSNNAATTSPVIVATDAGRIRAAINSAANNANSLSGPTLNSDNGVFTTTSIFGDIIRLGGDFALATPFNTTEAYTEGAFQNLFKYNIAANQTNSFVGTTSIGAGNVLTVAAVPEPGTYALMFAGLMTLGAVVRRRTRG